MITFFVEQDLVSFGNYLLSNARKEYYLNQGIEPDKVDVILSGVNNIDLTNWVNLIINASKQQENQSATTEQEVDINNVEPLQIVE